MPARGGKQHGPNANKQAGTLARTRTHTSSKHVAPNDRENDGDQAKYDEDMMILECMEWLRSGRHHQQQQQHHQQQQQHQQQQERVMAVQPAPHRRANSYQSYTSISPALWQQTLTLSGISSVDADHNLLRYPGSRFSRPFALPDQQPPRMRFWTKNDRIPTRKMMSLLQHATWSDFVLCLKGKWGTEYTPNAAVEMMLLAESEDPKETWLHFLAGSYSPRICQVDDQDTWEMEVRLESDLLFEMGKEVTWFVRFK